MTAKKDQAKAADVPKGHVEARVLTPCRFGRVDEVVVLPADEAAEGIESGVLDATPAAVAYAHSLTAGA